MAKFKKGDRVRVISNSITIPFGEKGTILENDSECPFIRMDKKIGVGDCAGLCEDGYGADIFEGDLELIELTTTISIQSGNTVYEITGKNITIKTKEI